MNTRYKNIALHEYLPEKYLTRATYDEICMHYAILDFKDGKARAQEWAAKVVGKALSGKDRSNIVFVCVPAHSHCTYKKRYGKFSEKVCEICGCQNGFPYVFVDKDERPMHLYASHHESNRLDNVILDADFFHGKNVIIFDDIITTGRTAARMAELLGQCGARVIGALFLAKTVHPRGR